MNAFREIQPTQAIIPVKKPRDAVEHKQEPQKERRKKKQKPEDDDKHKVDEFI